MPGVLYLIATPIGNLEDITLRALRILKEVDVIACEDTRHTQHLLTHFSISSPTISYHEHNEASRAAQLIERLESGQSVAVVTDAGTPLVSDPGFRIVRSAIEKGIQVIAIPGASAVLTALAGSGMPTDVFYFGGFLPPKQGQRRKTLESCATLEATLVFYEAPHRILETLEDLQAVMGDRQVSLARELTKMHEEFLRGTASEVRTALAARPAIKGEMTLLVSRERPAATELLPLEEAVKRLVAGGLSRMDAIKQVARERGLAKREVYQQLEQ